MNRFVQCARYTIVVWCVALSMLANSQGTDNHIIQSAEANLDDFKTTGSSGPDAFPSLIEIPLFNNRVIQLQRTKVEVRSEDNVSWFGYVVGAENSSAILVVKDGNITGRIDLDGALYRISPVIGDLHNITEEDLSMLPSLDNDHQGAADVGWVQESMPIKEGAANPQSSAGQGGETAAPGDPQVIDVLAVYTIEALQEYPDLAERIQLAIDFTNEAYSNSDIPHRLRLVAVEPLNVNETGTGEEILFVNDMFDGRLDFVHDLRMQHNADIISIWQNHIANYCGFASAVLSRVESASHTMRVSCGGDTFAHEVAHLQGTRHDILNDGNIHPFQYGHGSSSPTGQWRSLMSYSNACSAEGPCTRIPYFSSPLLTYDGEPLGDVTYRDNARVITETGETAADWSNQIFPDGAQSILVEYTDGTLAAELVEHFPGIWIGNTVMHEGVESVFVQLDGERMGEAWDYARRGVAFYGTLRAGSEFPVELFMWRDDTPMHFTYYERYNLLEVDHGLHAEESMYIRGTGNNFGTDNQMIHYGDDMWVGEMTFLPNRTNHRFKFDVYGDWQSNYGTSDIDGRVEPFGGDIPIPEPGHYRIYFNHSSYQYWMVLQPEVNEPPIADAGEEIYAVVGEPFSFDGSGSTDSDGSIVSYDWSVGTSGVNAEHIFNEVGEFNVVLTVTDDDGATSTDTVVVHVSEEQNNWRRTVVFIYGRTYPGQDMFIRGGIDHRYANDTLGWGCTRTNYRCSIPIRYLSMRNPNTVEWKTSDTYLDWYGLEAEQTSGAGSALDWTTNRWGDDWGPVRTYEVNGVGETPMNRWGSHYWIFEVEMDCSATVDGWFEFKSYVTNGPGWEGNFRQPGAPYLSNNHFGECGKLNVFRRNTSAPVTIEDF